MTSQINTRADPTGRSSKRVSAGAWARMNAPPAGENWVWLTRELISSPALRCLSRGGLLALFRILEEHLANAGRRNGQLVVTHADLAAYGVADGNQAEAIRELEALGFIATTEKGRLSYGSVNRASRFRLTIYPCAAEDGITTWPATNEWKAILTRGEAKDRQKEARLAPTGRAKHVAPPINRAATKRLKAR